MNSDVITENSILSGPTTAAVPSASVSSASVSSASVSSARVPFGKILRYTLIILILAFLGFNIFTYLGKTTEFITDFFRPVLNFFGYGVATVTRQTIDATAQGTKKIVDITAGAAKGGINVLENTLAHKQDLSTKKALQDAGPLPHDTTAERNTKSGYCFIGEDRGFRSCIRVGEGDQCMSGNIFPTMDQCINPALR